MYDEVNRVPTLGLCTSRGMTDMWKIPDLYFGTLRRFLLLSLFDPWLAESMGEEHIQMEDCLHHL